MAATTPPKKPARTRPATKPTAAQAAAAEANGDDYVIHFRGTDFTVARSEVQDMHMQMALEMGFAAKIIHTALGPEQSFQFLQLVKRGEDPNTVSVEFMSAFGDAVGAGNSSAS